MLNRYTIPFVRWYAILVTGLPTSNLDFSLHVLKSHTCKIDDSIVKQSWWKFHSRLVKRFKCKEIDEKKLKHTQLSLIGGLYGIVLLHETKSS